MRLVALVWLTLALLLGAGCAAPASTDWWSVGLLDTETYPPGPGLGAGWGVTPTAIDGYDSWDHQATRYLGFYRDNGPDWTGPAGFYGSDYRSPLAPGQTKAWTDLYLSFAPDTQPDVRRYLYSRNTVPGYEPPPGWLYTLYLDRVSDGVTYSGPYSWTLVPGGPSGFMIPLPRAATPDAWHGYRFHFEAAPVPEPSSLLALAGGLAALGLRRKRR